MHKRKRLSPSGEVNLVPIMNLVTILIPFLLMASAFVALAVIDVDLPAITPNPTTDVDVFPPTVQVGRDGYTVEGQHAATDQELAVLLRDLKDREPNQQSIVLVPDADVSYEIIIGVMDTARGPKGELFPQVVMAGGE